MDRVFVTAIPQEDFDFVKNTLESIDIDVGKAYINKMFPELKES